MSPLTLGPFEIGERIGRGGMGEVYRGVHPEQNVDIAIKVITPRWAREARYSEALCREVEAAARLSHPGIVRVYDLGEIPGQTSPHPLFEFTAGSPYFVMQYVAGGPLHFDAERTWDDVRSILATLLDALAHAHARGVVHRDIKPANILMGPNHEPCLTDFGLCRVFDSLGRRGTPTGGSGTPRFMAPEQIRADWRAQGPWTDLYAVGCLAHYLVMGRPPFDFRDVDDVFVGHLQGDVPGLESKTNVPAGFDEWLRTMLAKQPIERFRRAADALWSLIHLDGNRGEAVSIESAPLGTLRELAQLEFEPTLLLTGQTTQLQTTAPVETRPPVATPFRPEPPPFPESWRREDASQARDLVGVGLGIFGLRSVPLVGRNAERQILWEQLGDVHATRQPRAIVLRGDAGTGKSRLAEWMGERAEELGAATLLKVTHGPTRAAHDGFGSAIASYLRIFGLSPSEVHNRLKDFWLTDGATADELHACEALTHVICGGEFSADELPRYKFSSPSQRWSAIADFLGRIARDRPVFLWLDDAQWSAEALELTRYLLEHPDRVGAVFIVLTVKDEPLVIRPREALILESLGDDPNWTTLHIRPLDQLNHTRLVRSLLGLDANVARDLVERTAGNPLFAVQLIGDWVQRGLLDIGHDGFHLRDGRVPDIPDDIHALWSRRVSHTLAQLDPSWIGTARRALEVGAALGQEVDEREWHLVLSELSVERPRGLVSQLVAHRLAIRTDTGWAFTHGLLRESIQRGCATQDSLRHLHATIATTLEREAGIGEPARIAQHWLEAGEPGRALPRLFEAARLAFEAGEYHEADLATAAYERACESLAIGEDDPQRARVRVIVAKTRRERAEVDEARDLLERVETVARAHGDEVLLAETLATQGSLATLSGKLDYGLVLAEESLALYLKHGETLSAANVHRTLNWLELWSGRPETARAHLLEAKSLYLLEDDLDGLGWVHYELAAIALHRGEFDLAAELSEEAFRFFSKVGNRIAIADCLNMRGELHRARGSLDAAENWYREAHAIYERVGHHNELIARENLGLTLLAAARWSEARGVFQEVLAANAALDRLPMVLRNLAELLQCNAHLGDLTSWDEQIRKAAETMQNTGFSDVEAAECLTAAAGALADTEHARSLQAMGLAAELWGRLGRVDRVSDLHARMEETRTTEFPR